MWNNQDGFGDQGGGYMNSPGFGSQGQSQERKRQQRAHNITPCTVAQIMSAQHEDDRFISNNVDLHQVTIVGLVRSVKEAATRLDYEIDDMSGPPLEVRQFVDNDEGAEEADRTTPQRENTYVRVFGHVRAFSGKRNLVAFRIVPITDMNELTCHMLEVMHSGLSSSKGPQQSAGVGGSAPGQAQPGGYAGATGDSMDGLTPVQRQVHAVIRSCPDEQGININFISSQLRGVPPKEIRDAVEFLSSEGHIYSTIDDDHYKSTDAMD